MFIDTHCHLNFKAFNKDLPEVVKRAEKAGIDKIIIPGADIDSSFQAVKIAQKYPSCFAAVGIHPHHIQSISTKDDKLQLSPPSRSPCGHLEGVLTATNSSKLGIYSNVVKEISLLVSHPKVVAVGEIGLDYHQYKNCPPLSQTGKNNQKLLFLAQLQLAQKNNLPVIIHCRNAHDDLLALLNDYKKMAGKPLCGVFHCFAGSKTCLKKVLELGFSVGFDGNITYGENNSLKELVRLTPLKSLLLETDAPFLTPLPFRNTRNEPSYLTLVACAVAEIHKETVETITKSSSLAAAKLFHL